VCDGDNAVNRTMPELLTRLRTTLSQAMTLFGTYFVTTASHATTPPEGATQTGIPVFNVAHTLLVSHYPDKPPFRLFDVKQEPHDEQTVTPIADRRQRGRRATDRAEPE